MNKILKVTVTLYTIGSLGAVMVAPFNILLAQILLRVAVVAITVGILYVIWYLWK